MQRLATAVLPVLWLASCDATHPCNQDQVYEDSVCLPAAASTSGAADGGMRTTADASEPDDDAGPGSCTEALAEDLSRSCTGDAACGCAAPYCAIMPGQTAGTCTVYCRPSSHDCPDSYTCFDVSVFGVMGVQPFCLKM